MKRTERKIMIVLTLMLAAVLSASALGFAETDSVNGGSYVFNGDGIVTEGTDSLNKTISGMEPGDSVTIDLTYTNDSDEVTDWYMKNDVVKTLEDSSTASGGGYTYTLTNVGPGGQRTEIFSSDAVGGEDSEAGTGLHQADDATEEWFFIQELSAGKSGHTELYIALDGESQANEYQGTDADVDITYAVEVQEEGADTYKHVGSGKVKTGDYTDIILPLIAFLVALLLLVVAVISFRKDGKRGARDED